jgi:hypothetical protein
LNIAGTAGDAGAPAAGDLWFNDTNTVKHLRFFDGTNTHSLMFSDDQIQNTQLASSSITVNAGNAGIAVSGSPVSLGGAVSVSNAGVLSNIAGTGISINSATGNVTITNTGVTSLTGTANQVSVSTSTGGVTVSLPATINVSTTGNANTATVASSLTATTQCNPATTGLATGISVSGAAQCSTSGSALTSLNASNLSTGTVPAAQLPAATSSAFGAVRPTIVSATTNSISQNNNTVVNYTVSCAAGRFVLGGGYSASDVKLMPTANFPSAADTWRTTFTANGNVTGATVTVYAICSGN